MDEGDFAHVSCVVTKGDTPIQIRKIVLACKLAERMLLALLANSQNSLNMLV